MKLMATGNFMPKGVDRVVRAGEEIDAVPAVAKRLVKDGLGVPIKRAPEMLVRAARERAVPFRNLKETR